MFTLTIKLDAHTKYDLAGLAALDRRRELGLPDAATLATACNSTYVLEVGERDARSLAPLFCRATHATVLVTLPTLLACDVIEENGRVMLNPLMSPQRALQLAEGKMIDGWSIRWE